jgi:hypothetical protein
MIIIKNSKELAKLVDKNKDLSVDEDVRIEYQFTREELRDLKCRERCYLYTKRASLISCSLRMIMAEK